MAFNAELRFDGGLPRSLVLIAAFVAIVQSQVQAEPSPAEGAWINPSSEPSELVSTGKIVYFTADDGVHGRELWRTDGSPDGTGMLLDIAPGPEGSQPRGLRATGEGILFIVSLASEKPVEQIWWSDGTPEGTHALRDKLGEPHTPSPVMGAAGFDSWEGLLAVVADYNSPVGVALYDSRGEHQMLRTTDHDPEDATRITGLCVSGPALYALRATRWTQSNVFYPYVLWRIDRQLPEIATVSLGAVCDAELIGALGSKAVLRVTMRIGGSGPEPWISDGTQAGTYQLADILPGHEGGVPDPVSTCTFKDRLYFAADDGVHGLEPWVTDGTKDGTVLFKDVAPGVASSLPGMYTATADKLYFQAVEESTGHELWVTDGTPEGTHLTRDIYPGNADANPYRLTAAQDVLYFSIEDPEHGEELWRSDGSEEGTRLVSDIVPGPGSSFPYYKASLGPFVVFTANDQIHGVELWVSEGTAETTRLLKDIHPMRGPNPDSSPTQLYEAFGKLYFVVNKYPYGAELWRSDGTESGTFLVKDIFPGPPSSRAGEFLAFEDRLYFAAEDDVRGLELWVSDGTTLGTARIADIALGKDSSNPHELKPLREGTFVFVANDGKRGMELYTYETSQPSEGQDIVRDLYPGPNSSNPRELTLGELEGRPGLYFVANDGMHGEELWWMDSATENVQLVADIITNDVPPLPIELIQTQQGLFYTTGAPEKATALNMIPKSPPEGSSQAIQLEALR